MSDWDDVIRVNLESHSSSLLCRGVQDHKKGYGKIITISPQQFLRRPERRRVFAAKGGAR